ncbi:hypothetical protein CTI12_AA330720 [Artemisia annua]|uniref:Uncharacterized protein n=1 Tax=Artemisia annua TaxID=35608 RepID=A0A2U1MYK5_ARTAN|nr:hypothetical protein CTI12_AA330720 [Artemisia annua]
MAAEVQLKQKVKQEEELFWQWKVNDEKQLMQVMIIYFKLIYKSGTAMAHLINSFHTPQGAKLANENGNSLETQDKYIVVEEVGPADVYDQWVAPSVFGPSPKPRFESINGRHAAVVIDEKMYIFGGNHNGHYISNLHAPIRIYVFEESSADFAFEHEGMFGSAQILDELLRIEEQGGKVIYWNGARVLGVLGRKGNHNVEDMGSQSRCPLMGMGRRLQLSGLQ